MKTILKEKNISKKLAKKEHDEELSKLNATNYHYSDQQVKHLT